ncbi:MAG: hypothetical protein JO329_23995, partial [Planctomycetaceae bacterium]|nr:hypothetical protein [Planctomycetaceae bacterium]
MSQTMLERRREFLLSRFPPASKGHRLTASDLRKKLGTKEALKLGFDGDGTAAREAIRALIDAGLLIEEEKGAAGGSDGLGKGVAYRLTKEGIARLESLPRSSADRFDEIKTHDKRELLGNQKAFILLQVQRARLKGSKLTRSDLNAKLKTETNKRCLGLDRPTTNWVLSLLRDGGYIRERAQGGGRSYELTDDGVSYLVTLEQYPTLKISLTGEELNKLLAAVRETVVEAPTGRPKVSEKGVGVAPRPVLLNRAAPSDLSGAILRIFEELLRENYAHLEMVPIYAIRHRIAEEYGPESARHDVLDPQIHRMRQDRRIRMVALGDLSAATSEQLEGSIRGANETFFYLKATHEPARVRQPVPHEPAECQPGLP